MGGISAYRDFYKLFGYSIDDTKNSNLRSMIIKTSIYYGSRIYIYSS